MMRPLFISAGIALTKPVPRDLKILRIWIITYLVTLKLIITQVATKAEHTRSGLFT